MHGCKHFLNILLSLSIKLAYLRDADVDETYFSVKELNFDFSMLAKEDKSKLPFGIRISKTISDFNFAKMRAGDSGFLFNFEK